MKEVQNYIKRRQHLRTKVQSIVVGILNSKEPERVVSITDISLGGVKYACNVFRVATNKSPVHSIDLIAGSLYVLEIPCKCVWDGEVETESHTKLSMIRQCGIQFGKLTPWQSFSLKSIIDDCASLDNKSIISNKGTSQSSLLSALIAY
jgi:hypothetical protein